MSIKPLSESQVSEYFAITSSNMPGIMDWMRGLGSVKLEELARLEFEITLNYYTPQCIDPEWVEDWIEDHGGKREWWRYFNLRYDKEGSYHRELANQNRK